MEWLGEEKLGGAGLFEGLSLPMGLHPVGVSSVGTVQILIPHNQYHKGQGLAK